MSKKKRKKKSKFSTFVLIVCIPLFCVSAYMVFSQLYVDYRQNQAFGSLLEQVNRARANPAALVQTVDPGTAPEEGAVPAAEQETAPEPVILDYYAPLHEGNPDFFGWIEIPNTVVNYPVMHTPEDPEYYLHRAYDGSSAYSGVPFLDANCFLGCGNYIVYGHNMKNGTMFKTITNYSDKAYWESHPVIRFDTLYETGTYDIVAAFYAQAYSVDATGVFRYYQYNDLRTQERFDEYMDYVNSVALYDTGIDVEYGDELLTLSTCEYHKTNGRFVVVAKKR